MAFATTDDVAVRLGRELTTQEADLVDYVIEIVTGLIVDAVDRDADWADALAPVPPALKALCIEKAIAAGANPNGLAAETEQIGAHSRSRTFRRSDDGGLFLSDGEQRLARLAVYGTNAGSSSTESVIDRAVDLSENRDPDEDPPV